MKFYVVWNGRIPGIYTSWAECEKQVKSYSCARFKAFQTIEQAEVAFKIGYSKNINVHKTNQSTIDKNEIIWDSISVDASCLGNPGVMEFRGVYTRSREEIFREKYNLGTNNLGEFLAIVRGLQWMRKNNKIIPLYTDSNLAMRWIEKRRNNSNLKISDPLLQQDLMEAEDWLRNHFYNGLYKILKWNTNKWGEIPADFGRK